MTVEEEFKEHPKEFVKSLLSLKHVSKDERKLLDSIDSKIRKISMDADVYAFDHVRVSPDIGRQIEEVKPLIKEWFDKYARRPGEVV